MKSQFDKLTENRRMIGICVIVGALLLASFVLPVPKVILNLLPEQSRLNSTTDENDEFRVLNKKYDNLLSLNAELQKSNESYARRTSEQANINVKLASTNAALQNTKDKYSSRFQTLSNRLTAINKEFSLSNGLFLKKTGLLTNKINELTALNITLLRSNHTYSSEIKVLTNKIALLTLSSGNLKKSIKEQTVNSGYEKKNPQSGEKSRSGNNGFQNGVSGLNRLQEAESEQNGHAGLVQKITLGQVDVNVVENIKHGSGSTLNSQVGIVPVRPPLDGKVATGGRLNAFKAIEGIGRNVIQSKVSFVMPTLKSGNRMPYYPSKLLLDRIQGTVKIEVLVDKRGRVKNYKILSTSHNLFSSEVRKVIEGWKFNPARQSGMPIDCSVVLPIQFKPND